MTQIDKQSLIYHTQLAKIDDTLHAKTYIFYTANRQLESTASTDYSISLYIVIYAASTDYNTLLAHSYLASITGQLTYM